MLEAAKRSIWTWAWSEPDAGNHGGIENRFRTLIRILLIVATEFKKDAIPLRASALTYTIILSMVPVLALGTAVLKGLGAGDQMKKAAYAFIDRLETVEHTGNQDLQQQGDKSAAPPSMASHLRRAADTVFDYVEKTNFATLGILGTIGMLLTVISVLGNIEQAMNTIWQTDSSRPLGRKVMDYLALMILLPLAVNIGLATMTALQSETLLKKIQTIFPMPWTGPLIIHIFTLFVIITTFVTLYRFLPNMKIPFYPALAGGVTGGVTWLLVQAAYIKLQLGVAKYNAIYGSFATLPLFLIWIYVGWMVFLAGAEVAFATHVWRRYVPGRNAFEPALQLSVAYDLLLEIYKDFKERRLSQPNTIAGRLSLSQALVAATFKKLVDAGLLRHTEGKDEGFFPSTAADMVKATEIFETIIGSSTQNTKGGHIALRALGDAKKSIKDVKLSDIMSGDMSK